MATFPLIGTVSETLKAWANSLRNLTFNDNFKSYEWIGELEAGEEKGITHRLKVIPTRFIIISAKNTNQIIEGDTRHTNQFFYVKNVATTSKFVGRLLILP